MVRLLEFVNLALCSFLIVYIIRDLFCTSIEAPIRVAKYATLDLHYVGHYDYKLLASAKRWFYSILALTYLKNKSNVMPALDRAVKQYTHDPDGIIAFALASAYNDYLEIVNKHLEKEATVENYSEPICFKIDTEYDYHVLPRLLQYNDYIQPEKILEAVDDWRF